MFIRELLNVSTRNAVSVSLRASNAATMSIRQNATNPIDWPSTTLP